MGQQQLLLLILAAVIVGAAVVLGINMFGQNAAQANQDAIMQDILVIASKAQSWQQRPVEMGGGGGTFTKLTDANGWGLLNFPKTNANAAYTLTPAAGTLDIKGVGNENPNGTGTNLQITAKVYPDSIAQVTISDP